MLTSIEKVLLHIWLDTANNSKDKDKDLLNIVMESTDYINRTFELIEN